MKINIINTTTNSEETAKLLAEGLVKMNLSPCVQVIQNNVSFYKWKDEIKKSKEFIIKIKTIPANLDKCKKYILEYHNYDIPEIIVTYGEILVDNYKDWFLENINP